MVSVNPPLPRQESYFAYLFGVREPGFYGAVVSSLPFLYQRKVNPFFVNVLVNLAWVGINYLQLVLFYVDFGKSKLKFASDFSFAYMPARSKCEMSTCFLLLFPFYGYLQRLFL
jgi:hypothetical protein